MDFLLLFQFLLIEPIDKRANKYNMNIPLSDPKQYNIVYFNKDIQKVLDNLILIGRNATPNFGKIDGKSQLQVAADLRGFHLGNREVVKICKLSQVLLGEFGNESLFWVLSKIGQDVQNMQIVHLTRKMFKYQFHSALLSLSGHPTNLHDYNLCLSEMERYISAHFDSLVAAS